MKSRILIFSLLLISGFCFAQKAPVKHQLYTQKAKLEKVSADFSFTEGPAMDQQGNIFFTDQPNDRILKWDQKSGQISTFLEPAGRSNGLYIDTDGDIYACADAKNQLWKISPEKEVTVLVENFQGDLLNGPNDLWIAPDGGIYFTDPFYKRDYWDRSEKEIAEERVYYLSPNGKLSIAAADFVRPNGIVGTADGLFLYVADINDAKTYRFRIEADGSLSNRTLFCEMGSDGMTLDQQGNLYLTGKGITVFSPEGQKIAHIEVPENWTANVTFGGKKRKTLFVTAMGTVYTLKMKVKGQ